MTTCIRTSSLIIAASLTMFATGCSATTGSGTSTAHAFQASRGEAPEFASTPRTVQVANRCDDTATLYAARGDEELVRHRVAAGSAESIEVTSGDVILLAGKGGIVAEVPVDGATRRLTVSPACDDLARASSEAVARNNVPTGL